MFMKRSRKNAAIDEMCLPKLLAKFTTVKHRNPTPLPGFAASDFVRA